MIYVLSALCGAGKTTVMLKTIKENLDKKWLFITPLLSEVEDRIPKDIPEGEFHSPNVKVKGSKLEDIKDLLRKGKNITSTHVLFKLLDGEAVDLILEKGYNLVIDEAVDAVSEYKEGLNKHDTHALITGDFVTVNGECRDRLDWNEEKYPEHSGKYKEVRKMCQNNMLYVYKGKFLMCEYPPKLLQEIKACYVLSYLFQACTMRYWLDVNQIAYQYVPHDKVGLRDEKVLRGLIRDNLEVVSNRTLDRLQGKQKPWAFSKTWLSNVASADISMYRAIMRSHVVSHKVKSNRIFWTTYKEHVRKLEDQGYKSCHLPVNIKATNDYKDRTFCMYGCNLYSNVTDGNYIESLGTEITQEDKDMFALSNLIQFMFRGSIREHKPMKILILSKRVRDLLIKWLGEDK